MDDIRVYVVDTYYEFTNNVTGYTIQEEDPDVINEVMDVAEEQGTVYSLRGFQEALNLEDVNISTSWVLFWNKNVKVK